MEDRDISTKLNSELQAIVDLLFSEEDNEAASQIILQMEGRDCWLGTERTQFSVLKLSRGSLDRLHKALQLEMKDPRELASAAFAWGDHEAYKKWVPKPGEASGWERFREWRHGFRTKKGIP